MPKKLKGESFGIFQHPFCRKTPKNEGGLFGVNFFSKKMSKMPNKLKGGTLLVSPGIVCYAEKKEKPFWFSSLGQQVQFGVSLKFCRTFSRTILVTSGVSTKKNTDEKP